MKIQGQSGYAQQDAKGDWSFFDNQDNAVTTIGKEVIPEVNEGVVNMVLGVRASALNSGAQIHANNMNSTISNLLGTPLVVQQLSAISQQLNRLIVLLAPKPPKPPGKKTPVKKKRGKK